MGFEGNPTTSGVNFRQLSQQLSPIITLWKGFIQYSVVVYIKIWHPLYTIDHTTFNILNTHYSKGYHSLLLTSATLIKRPLLFCLTSR